MAFFINKRYDSASQPQWIGFAMESEKSFYSWNATIQEQASTAVQGWRLHPSIP